MRTSSLVGHVVEVLDMVRAGRRPADGIVREFFRTRHYLGSSDRRYIADRTYNILRHEDLLSAYCTASGLKRPVPSVALAAAHEARMQEPPPEDEQLVPDFGGLWRMMVPDSPLERFLGVLRAAEIPGDPEGDPASYLALRHSIPRFVVADWLKRFGREEAEGLCAASNGGAPVTIRVNTLKGTRAMCQETLASEGVGTTPTSISPDGLILQKRVNVPGLRAFVGGWFEMQDEGSQILSYLAGAVEGMTVLDACAGGGGKSLHMAALMNNRGRLIAADVDGKKLANFMDRAARAGVRIAETFVVGLEGEVFPAGIEADLVLVDAPCSGVGTFRRSPWLKRSLTEEASDRYATGQIQLLGLYARYVRPGGHLVYSTCTLLRRENRDVAEAFAAAHPAFEEIPARDLLATAGLRVAEGEGPSLELLPHRTGTDGFFGAVFRRRTE
jgi:16S rRNA (cytosine967-C5)-methyltransferase